MNFKYFLEQNSDSEWKAKKKDIISFWNNLHPNLPLNMEPVPPWHKGTRYEFDGIRITGKPTFINSVISRLKDIIPYDNQLNSKLDIEYRKIANKDKSLKQGSSYVFYIHAVPRNKK